MSSDDSEVEDDIKEIYHPKLLPWHQQEADAYMDILDRTRKLPGQQSHSKRGRPPTKWTWQEDVSINSESSHGATCCALPSAIDGWLDNHRKVKGSSIPESIQIEMDQVSK